MSILHRNYPALLWSMFLCVLLCVWLTPSAFAASNVDGNTVAQLEAAVNNGASTFTLNGNMEIPADTRVEAPGVCIVVPSGKTLTVKGQLNVPALKLTGGSVNLQADSKFNVYDALTYSSGSINVYAGAGVGIAGAGISSKLDTIFSFKEQSGNINLLFYAENANELSSVITNTVGLSNRYHAVVCVDFDCVFSEVTTTIHEGLSLVFRRGFTLPEGCTLQMPQVGNFIVNSGVTAEIYGTVHGSGLIVNEHGLFKLYGNADFGKVTLNGDIATFDGTGLSVYGEMNGLNNGCPNGTLHVGGSAYVMIEAKNLNTGAIESWTVFHGDESTLLLNMGIGFNQPTTKYVQKAGPREIFWTGRGVE